MVDLKRVPEEVLISILRLGNTPSISFEWGTLIKWFQAELEYYQTELMNQRDEVLVRWDQANVKMLTDLVTIFTQAKELKEELKKQQTEAAKAKLARPTTIL